MYSEVRYGELGVKGVCIGDEGVFGRFGAGDLEGAGLKGVEEGFWLIALRKVVEIAIVCEALVLGFVFEEIGELEDSSAGGGLKSGCLWAMTL